MSKLTLSRSLSHPSFATVKVGCLLAACLCFALSSVHAQTQAAMNAQARADFERADTELNRTYQALLAKLPDAKSKQELKQTQRAWLASRDAKVTLAADQARGGSMAATIRYETMTELTRERVKELKIQPKDASSARTPRPSIGSVSGPASPPEPASQQAGSISQTPEPTASSSSNSLSPDKKWEYADEDGPKIVKGGTNEVALDLDCKGGVLWAPDSKRFAFNCGGGGRWHTTSLYQLRGDQWKELKSPSPEDEVLAVAEKAIAAQVKKRGLPKKTDLRLIWGTLEVRQWVDSNTAVLYAGLEEAVRENLDEAFGAHFLVTLKFDEAGNWKIIKTHRMSDKEVEKIEKGE